MADWLAVRMLRHNQQATNTEWMAGSLERHADERKCQKRRLKSIFEIKDMVEWTPPCSLFTSWWTSCLSLVCVVIVCQASWQAWRLLVVKFQQKLYTYNSSKARRQQAIQSANSHIASQPEIAQKNIAHKIWRAEVVCVSNRTFHDSPIQKNR